MIICIEIIWGAFMRVLFLLVCLLLFSFEANACYTAAEVEAEQGVRIHSELMVIGLTCNAFIRGDDNYRAIQYEAFTNKHARLLSEYEEILIAYYKRQGYYDPELQFHALRTKIANEISQHAVDMSVQSFCEDFSERIDKATLMDRKRVRQWANAMWKDGVLSEAVCGR